MPAEFQVESIVELTGRGGAVIGQIIAGEVRIGMRTLPLRLTDSPEELEVSSVEFVGYRSERRSAVALLFRGWPSADELRHVIAPGAILHLR